jgi:hypothetical protein
LLSENYDPEDYRLELNSKVAADLLAGKPFSPSIPLESARKSVMDGPIDESNEGDEDDRSGNGLDGAQ